MFVTCILMQRQVDKYLSGRVDLKEVRSIIRYYVSMATACNLAKQATGLNDKVLAALLPVTLKPFDVLLLDSCAAAVMSAYLKHGGTETVAKGPDMRETIISDLKAALLVA